MIKHRKLLPIVEFISLTVTVFSFFSCASKEVGRVTPPEWFTGLIEKQEGDCFYFPVSGEGEKQELVAREVSELIFGKLMEVSDLSDLYGDSRDQEALQKAIQGLYYPENVNAESLSDIPLLLVQSEWVFENGCYGFFGYFCIPSDVVERLEKSLADEYFGADELLNALLAEAESFGENGLLYQSAESFLKAASHVFKAGGPVSQMLAQRYVEEAAGLLERIAITVEKYPARVQANTKVDIPFVLRCMEGVVGVRDMEFLVQYQGRKRDGSIGAFEVRIVSDGDGYVSFYHPFLPFAGESHVLMSPGSRDMHTILRDLASEIPAAAALKLYLEEQAVSLDFTVESAARLVPTGIVILHTDMTGANLNSKETASGLREILSQDGFDAEIMPLSPLEITASNEASFLRDLKAAYSSRYTRVIFGVVGINDFEIRNDLYMVETRGVLKVVDIRTGEILMVSEKTKSVESKDNTLAVAASFKELGKAFAEEMKDSLY